MGTGFEPEALDMKSEMEKLERKLEARVDYIMTQPVFNHAALDALTPFREHSALLVGVLILANADHARRMAAVPGMVVPDEVLARLRFDMTRRKIRPQRAQNWRPNRCNEYGGRAGLAST